MNTKNNYRLRIQILKLQKPNKCSAAMDH